MTTVYVLEYCDYDDSLIHGVFSSEEKAQEFLDGMKPTLSYRNRCYICDYVIDQGEISYH